MSDYEKLKKIYNEIEELYSESGTDSSKFKGWEHKLERFIIKKYGKDSDEIKKVRSISFCSWDFTENCSISERNAYVKGLNYTKAILENYLEELKEEENNNIQVKETNNIIKNKPYSKVFIVHGHDGELKEKVARLIEKQDIKAIILHEQTNNGSTIIEKIEKNSDVDCAICLFTADDEGKSKKDEYNKERARQNVVFETGYFIGKLKRENVIIIANSDVEMPSDLQGVVYTNQNSWELEILRGLRDIGYNIDMNKL